MRQPGGHVRPRWSGPVLSAVFRGDDDDRAARVLADLGADRPRQQPGDPARAAGSDDDHVRVPGGGQEPACRAAVEQSGKELADLGEDRDQPLMERIRGTRYYGR